MKHSLKAKRNCTRKTTYSSKEGALAHRHHPRLKPYLCNVCGLWHLTSKGMRKPLPTILPPNNPYLRSLM